MILITGCMVLRISPIIKFIKERAKILGIDNIDYYDKSLKYNRLKF